MIKFFRQIRQRLLADNKISKYLLYALGEIILVVIGILIALAINDAYTASKNEQKIKTILAQIQEDLLTDIKDSQRIFRHYVRKDSTAQNIYKDLVSVDTDTWKLRPYEGYVNFSINRGGYQRLMDNLEFLPEKYTGLIPRLNRIYVVIQEDVTDNNEKIIAKSDDPRFNRIYSHPEHAEHMFSDFSTKEAKQYLLDDPFLKNRIIEYMTAFRNVAFIAHLFRVEATALYKQIDTLLGNQDTTTPEHLRLYPTKEDIGSFLGDYTKTEGNMNRQKLSLKYESNKLFILNSSGRQDLVYWHQDNYLITGRAEIIRLFKNGKGQHIIERSNGVRYQIMMKE